MGLQEKCNKNKEKNYTNIYNNKKKKKQVKFLNTTL